MRRGAQRGRVNEGLILFVLFFGPVFLALLAYLGPWEVVPDRSAAYGVLMDPVRPLAPPGTGTGSVDPDKDGHWFTGRWSLIYLSGQDCDQACRDRLFALGQIHKALAEERDRVQPVFLHPAVVKPADVAAFVNVPLEGDTSLALASKLTDAHPGPIYVSDPLGNLVLAYPADARDKGILKDLERLLRLSRIG